MSYSVELHIPVLPPSVNDMYGYGRRRVFRSRAYKKWLHDAGLIVNSQRPPGIVGPYKLSIMAARQNERADIDNIIKPTSDLLQEVGVIANDCYCELVSARWVTTGEGLTIRLERAGLS